MEDPKKTPKISPDINCGRCLSRRQFLVQVPLGVAGLGVLGACAHTGETPPRRGKITLPVADIRGGMNYFRLERLALLKDDRGLGAMSLLCTHQECAIVPPASGEGMLLCPCHGSGFDLTGRVLSGPATKNLPWYTVTKLSEAEIEVDLASVVDSAWRLKI